MNKSSDRRLVYILLLPAALIVVVTGCSSIPTANIHPAKPLKKNSFRIQGDLLLCYDPSKMITQTDFTEFRDRIELTLPAIGLSGQYGITDRTDISAMLYFFPPLVGFDTNIKRSIIAEENRWLSLELGVGSNIVSDYNNYYFYAGALYEYHLPCDLGFNVRFSGYCANVDFDSTSSFDSVDGFYRLFFPELGLSVISPEESNGRVSYRASLNCDLVVWNNPIDEEWHSAYSCGLSLIADFLSKKQVIDYE